MTVDTGSYNYDAERYQQLVNALYADYSAITLPPEYAYFVQEDLLRLLIRLARYKFVARLLKKTDHALEIGCGSGLGSIFLSQYCTHVTGMDVKTTEVEEARSINRRQNVEFKVGDFFELEAVTQYDVVVAMYHDQGLIPLKMLGFEEGVNITIGLPIIRTSPDHGSAYDIAGRGIANPSSMIKAIELAVQMTYNEKA